MSAGSPAPRDQSKAPLYTRDGLVGDHKYQEGKARAYQVLEASDWKFPVRSLETISP